MKTYLKNFEGSGISYSAPRVSRADVMAERGFAVSTIAGAVPGMDVEDYGDL